MRLLQADPEEIPEIIQKMRSEAGAFRKAVREVVFFLQGGITWNEAWNMGMPDLIEVREQIKDQIETAKKQSKRG